MSFNKRPDFKILCKTIHNMSKQQIKQFLIKHKNEFLDEFLLRFYIAYYFFDDEVIFNRQLSGTKIRPDAYIKNKNLIVEYDGPTHYTNNAIVLKDVDKDFTFDSMGLDIIRIPFFIEMGFNETNILFKKYIKAEQEISSKYLSGFTHENVILPSSFCVRGLLRYICETGDVFYKSSTVKNNIWKTLAFKVLNTGSIRQVFSPMQHHDACLIAMWIIDSDRYNILATIKNPQQRAIFKKSIIDDFKLFEDERMGFI